MGGKEGGVGGKALHLQAINQLPQITCALLKMTLLCNFTDEQKKIKKSAKINSHNNAVSKSSSGGDGGGGGSLKNREAQAAGGTPLHFPFYNKVILNSLCSWAARARSFFPI